MWIVLFGTSEHAGNPNPPQELRHVISANTESSAVIQWQPPLYTGGSLIRYTVTANGQTESVSGDMFTYNITGLDVNTDYTVEVTAVNSCGLESEPATITVIIQARGIAKNTIKLYKVCCYSHAHTYLMLRASYTSSALY